MKSFTVERSHFRWRLCLTSEEGREDPSYDFWMMTARPGVKDSPAFTGQTWHSPPTVEAVKAFNILEGQLYRVVLSSDAFKMSQEIAKLECDYAESAKRAKSYDRLIYPIKREIAKLNRAPSGGDPIKRDSLTATLGEYLKAQAEVQAKETEVQESLSAQVSEISLCLVTLLSDIDS